MVALGLLGIFYDEYSLKPEHRLIADTVQTMLKTSAQSSIFAAHATPQMGMPATATIATLNEVQRGWFSGLPTSSDDFLGDVLVIDTDTNTAYARTYE